jgi:hypothetical protein
MVNNNKALVVQGNVSSTKFTSPEIHVYVTAPGSEKRMSLVACSANKKKSLSAIYLPPLAEPPKSDEDY